MSELDSMDSVLGTPSAQQILRILSTRDLIDLKELVRLTSLSHSQIQATLQNLIRIRLVVRQTRGIYKLNDSSMANNFKTTYLKTTIYFLNEQINIIFELLKKGEKDQAFAIFETISDKYSVILERNFSDILENLSHQLLENV
jgi:hypothetical protein